MGAARQPDENSPSYHFAIALREVREARDMNQLQLCEAMLARGVRITQGVLSGYETGQSGCSDRRVEAFEEVLDAGGALWEAKRRDANLGRRDRETPRLLALLQLTAPPLKMAA